MTEDHDDFAFEPVRGLPERLPQGERLLWQGSPQWRRLAIEAFHVRKVAVYFALVALWQGLSAEAFVPASFGWLAVAALASISILCGLAFLYARSTVYSLTTKRLVIRSGLALPVTLNLPLSLVQKAALRRHRDGTGSLALEVAAAERVAWLVLWPNVRPWTLNHPQPMLRALADIDVAMPLLADALAVSQAQPASPQPTPERARQRSIGNRPGIAAGEPANAVL